MPLQRVGPDSNGLYYQAVTTVEWSGALGVQLRMAGYRYCGYGTWGVYVAAPGQECYTRDASQPPPLPPPPGPGGPGPSIGPTAPPQTTGGTGSTPAPITVGGCGRCGQPPQAVTPPAPTGGAPVPVPPARPGVQILTQVKGLPWWVFVLAALALSQFFNRGQRG